MPVAVTHDANQWPVGQFNAVIDKVIATDKTIVGVHISAEQTREAMLAEMLSKITPAGNA